MGENFMVKLKHFGGIDIDLKLHAKRVESHNCTLQDVIQVDKILICNI